VLLPRYPKRGGTLWRRLTQVRINERAGGHLVEMGRIGINIPFSEQMVICGAPFLGVGNRQWFESPKKDHFVTLQK